jgi:biotin operon repressor
MDRCILAIAQASNQTLVMTRPRNSSSPPGDSQELAARCAALADESRLRLVALLARRPHFGEELAELLGLKPATISHHLRRLREVGLVRAEKQSPYVLYRLHRAPLTELAALLGRPGELAAQMGLPSEEELSEHILRGLLDDEGRLRAIPRQRRHRAVLLRFLARHFDTGRIYPEREIRRVLLRFHDDPQALLDLLLQTGWLQRSGSVLRRLEEVEDS